jgi:uncharacterized protein with HEPN domain
MKRDPILYLDDMLTYARAAHEFVQGMTADAFKRDTRTQYAIAYALHIVGEAARNVPAEMRQRYPQIPWQEIIGMRNRLAHDYLGTRPDIVLATAQRFVPELIATLKPILAELGGPEDGPPS